MAYITKEIYAQKIGKPPEDFDILNGYTTTFIDQETLWGLINRNIEAFPKVILEAIYNAAALQIQFMDAKGGIEGFTDIASPNMTLGKFSYSGSQNNQNEQLCPMAKNSLILVNAFLRGLN